MENYFSPRHLPSAAGGRQIVPLYFLPGQRQNKFAIRAFVSHRSD